MIFKYYKHNIVRILLMRTFYVILNIGTVKMLLQSTVENYSVRLEGTHCFSDASIIVYDNFFVYVCLVM